MLLDSYIQKATRQELEELLAQLSSLENSPLGSILKAEIEALQRQTLQLILQQPGDLAQILERESRLGSLSTLNRFAHFAELVRQEVQLELDKH